MNAISAASHVYDSVDSLIKGCPQIAEEISSEL